MSNLLQIVTETLTELGFLSFLLSISVAVLKFITDLLFTGNIFRKAGYKRYIAIIPYYNTFTLALLATGSESWAIISGLPGLRVIGMIYTAIKLFPSFGKSVFFGICYLILPLRFIYIIGYAITALDNSTYMGPAPGWDTDDEEDEEFGPGIDDDDNIPAPKPKAKPTQKVVKKKVVKKVKK